MYGEFSGRTQETLSWPPLIGLRPLMRFLVIFSGPDCKASHRVIPELHLLNCRINAHTCHGFLGTFSSNLNQLSAIPPALSYIP